LSSPWMRFVITLSLLLFLGFFRVVQLFWSSDVIIQMKRNRNQGTMLKQCISYFEMHPKCIHLNCLIHFKLGNLIFS
jgi:hypothetical protein